MQMSKSKFLRPMFFLALAMFCSTGLAHAVVVDRFRCSLRYVPTEDSKAIESSVDVAAVRSMSTFNSTDDISVTEGTFGQDLTLWKDRFQVSFRLVYLHAVQRLNLSREFFRGASHVCMSYSVLSGGSKAAASGDCHLVCNKAFDPKCKWSPVETSKDGVPVFDAKLLQPVALKLAQGTLSISCKFKDTIE